MGNVGFAVVTIVMVGLTLGLAIDLLIAFISFFRLLKLNANSEKTRKKFHEEWVDRMSDLKKQTQKYGWGFLPIKTDSDYINELCYFCFQRKEK